VSGQGHFWRDLRAYRLMGIVDHAAVEAKIAERVPEPTPEERATARPPTDWEREAEERDRAWAADEERRRINREKRAARKAKDGA